MNRRNFLKSIGASVTAASIPVNSVLNAKKNKPNIIWVIVEDMSCHFSYQGETTIETPNVDKLAKEGVQFTDAYITCPVCSPSRSAMITGMYQTTIGAHNHRSSRGKIKTNLLKNIKLIPEYFKEAGYYVSNLGGIKKKGKNKKNKKGKTDYNFVYDPNLYDGADWSGRKPGQPFFAQIQLKGGKHRNAKVKDPVDPAKVKLPPYYPNHPVIRKDWAKYLNSVKNVDKEINILMKRLEKEELLDNTIIIFMTDHGISHARGKQFLYDEGIKIPFIVWAPKRLKPAKRKDYIVHIDMAATSMYFAGIKIPDYMESRPLFGPDAKPRDYIIAARDRCDETVEHLRCVKKDNIKYIRNFYPERPFLQPNAYKDSKAIIKALREWHKLGKLNKVQSLIMAEARPKEELYDLNKDPWEINNVANDKKYKTKLKELRNILNKWIKETDDKGQNPETEKMYDSDMKLYLDKRSKKPKHKKITLDNIQQMKKWAAEGK